MKLLKIVKTFFGGHKVTPVDSAARSIFMAASDAYDSALEVVESYSTRANHRYALLEARRALYNASLDDHSAADTYDETVAEFTDPLDHEHYTDVYLDAHTAAMDTLGSAFIDLTAALVALSATDHLYSTAANIYKAHCELHKFAASAYSHAAHCASTNALEDQLQAAKDECEVYLLELRISNPNEPNPAATQSRAAAWKAKTTELQSKARILEQKAKDAEIKAQLFLAQAEGHVTNPV